MINYYPSSVRHSRANVTFVKTYDEASVLLFRELYFKLPGVHFHPSYRSVPRKPWTEKHQTEATPPLPFHEWTCPTSSRASNPGPWCCFPAEQTQWWSNGLLIHWRSQKFAVRNHFETFAEFRCRRFQPVKISQINFSRGPGSKGLQVKYWMYKLLVMLPVRAVLVFITSARSHRVLVTKWDKLIYWRDAKKMRVVPAKDFSHKILVNVSLCNQQIT